MTTQKEPVVDTLSWQFQPGAVRHVAVIGAGASGLVAAKTLLQAGLEVTVYEAGSMIGGLWVYENDNGAPIAYRNLYILTPKRYTQWRDFPFDDATPEFAHHTDMARYFEQYADFFDVKQRVRFNDRVLQVRRIGTKWEVTSQIGKVKKFDVVVVATGHFSKPRWPDSIAGFTGELLHASQYREPGQASNKRVLVIGLGNSGVDIAADVSWVASRTAIAARTPVFTGPRWLFGLSILDILCWFQGPRMPKVVVGKLARWLVRISEGDLTKWGFQQPRKGGHGVLQEFLLPILKYGRISLRPDIAVVNNRLVAFADGTAEEFDLVVAATGYELTFPFLKGLVELVNDSSEVDDVYLRIFSIQHPGLCFVGLANNNGVANTPNFERAAELIADVLTGNVELPPRQQMREAVRLRRARAKELYHNTLGHSMDERHPDYVIEIVQERRKRSITSRRAVQGTSPQVRLIGSRCWVCNVVISPDGVHWRHATDWGTLRWWSSPYTKRIKLCAKCYRRSRRTLLKVIATAIAIVFIGLASVVGLAKVIVEGLG